MAQIKVIFKKYAVLNSVFTNRSAFLGQKSTVRN